MSATSSPGKAWGGRTPRRWQAEAFPVVRAALAAGVLNGSVVYACTGSGKSIFAAEVLAQLISDLPPRGTIIVSTPTVALVDQLYATLAARLASCAVRDRPPTIGRYYTHAKDVARDVVVTCMPSFGPLVAALADAGRSVTWWVADECHRTEATKAVAAWTALSAANPDCKRVGFSATPYLSDPRAGLSLWERCIVSYTPDQAIADGALVPWREHYLDAATANDIRGAEPEHADALIDAACVRWVGAQTGPGVVSAASIEAAEAFAQSLRDAEIPALAIHSRMSRDIARARVAAIRTGKIRALVHVSMLVEGVDLPWLRWGALRAERTRVALVQETGRYLRCHTPAPSDPDAHLGPKRHVDLWDPLRQLALHGLTHPAALADVAAEDDREAQEERERKAVEAGEMIEIVDPITGKTYRLPASDKLRTNAHQLIMAHSEAAQYVTTAALALRTAALLGAATYGAGRWRTQPASDKQIALLVKLQSSMRAITHAGPHGRGIAAAYRLIMAEHDAATSASGGATTIRKGTVSDLLDLTGAIRVVSRLPSGQWDTSRQAAAFAALDAMGVDPNPLIAAAETATAARRALSEPKPPPPDSAPVLATSLPSPQPPADPDVPWFLRSPEQIPLAPEYG